MSQPSPELRLIALASMIAAYPPVTPTRVSKCAYVDWEYIEGLRATLDAMGIPWRNARKIVKGTPSGEPQ